MARLLYVDAHGAPTTVELPQAGAQLGRAPGCLVRSEDLSTSRFHARLLCEGGHWYVEDLASRGGTFVNELPVQRHALAHNDLIRCGGLLVRFVLPPEGAGPLPKVGAYQLQRVLGQGGQGTVYEAVHESLGRRAAVKILNADLSAQPEWEGRFFNEARVVNLIRHPGIVDISDFGRLPSGSLFLIMELLEGQSLRQHLKASVRLSLSVALNFAHQIAIALLAAHQQGVVHRDLKPENVFLVADPLIGEVGRRTKLLDFGIAKVQNAAEGRGQILGTPQYMSPEQCVAGAPLDERSDVYALGVMLYEMIAGQVPFDDPNPLALLAKHRGEEPAPLAALVPETPPQVVELVHRMLRKDARERPSSAQLVAELARLVQQHKDVSVPAPMAQGLLDELHRQVQRTAGDLGAVSVPRLLVRQGDITTERVDAIVNAANQTLLGGSGVDGAIHRAAGPGLLEECRRLGGCNIGEARITMGYNLPARYVIHTVGPVWRGGHKGEDALLASCYQSCLLLAEQHQVQTLAFPAISTGSYSFPLARAAQIAVATVRAFLQGHALPRQVVLVCYGPEATQCFEAALRA